MTTTTSVSSVMVYTRFNGLVSCKWISWNIVLLNINPDKSVLIVIGMKKMKERIQRHGCETEEMWQIFYKTQTYYINTTKKNIKIELQ